MVSFALFINYFTLYIKHEFSKEKYISKNIPCSGNQLHSFCIMPINFQQSKKNMVNAKKIVNNISYCMLKIPSVKKVRWEMLSRH
jgi:hypothetical protein